MLAYQVQGMTCGHCVDAVTRAVLSVDAAAQVEVNLDRHSVQVGSVTAKDEVVRRAIEAAGYQAVSLKADASRAPAQADRRSGGCCCGAGGNHCAG